MVIFHIAAIVICSVTTIYMGCGYFSLFSMASQEILEIKKLLKKHDTQVRIECNEE